MFLPYAKSDDEQQCLQTVKGNDGVQAKGYRYKGADFSVGLTYDANVTNLSHVMDEINERKDVLLDVAL